MSRVRVWYDDECDQIFISGETHSFAPRSLICIVNGGGSTILVQMRGTEGSYIAGGSFADFGNHDGLPFNTPEDAKAYLDGVFTRQPAVVVPRFLYEAGEPLSGQRVVRLSGVGIVRVASCDDISQAGLVLGVTVHAADEGADVDVMVLGALDDPSLTLTPGPVFLGLNGALVQTPPTLGFVQQIGTATLPTRLMVERAAPIILAQ